MTECQSVWCKNEGTMIRAVVEMPTGKDEVHDLSLCKDCQARFYLQQGFSFDEKTQARGMGN